MIDNELDGFLFWQIEKRRTKKMQRRSSREPEDSEKVKSRREYFCERFLHFWFSEAIPILADELGETKNTVLRDVASEEFKEMLSDRLGLVRRDIFHNVADPLREQFLSDIRLAAISSDKPNAALKNTINAITEYLAALMESALLDTRFEIEAVLNSRDRAPLDDFCDKCGAPMQIVHTEYDSFFAGCSGYPECSNSRQLSMKDYEAAPRVLDRWENGDLEAAIGRLLPYKASLDVQRHLQSYDEASTRADFIDPILRALGWNTFTNGDVRKEVKTGSGKADYVLYAAEGQAFAVVEAKKLYEDLEDHRDQLFRYMKAVSTNLGVLTNGLSWAVYDLRKGFCNDPALEMRVSGEVRDELLNRLTQLIGKE